MHIVGRTGTGTSQKITFDVAVIRISDSKGWLLQNQTKEFTSSSVTEAPAISISTMTNSKIATLAGLNGYKVYLIVKRTTEYGNFDTVYLKTVNVIRVYPNPYTP